MPDLSFQVGHAGPEAPIHTAALPMQVQIEATRRRHEQLVPLQQRCTFAPVEDQNPVSVMTELDASPLQRELFKLRLSVSNAARSSHLVREGCPVLASEEGDRDAMLCSPIFLCDYPKVATENRTLFDEIDGGALDNPTEHFPKLCGVLRGIRAST